MVNHQQILQAYCMCDFDKLRALLGETPNIRFQRCHLWEFPSLEVSCILETSLLFLACVQNDLLMIEFLVSCGLDLNFGAILERQELLHGTKAYAVSPLFVTTDHAYHEASQLLINAGADDMRPTTRNCYF